eukprot:COSAG05_NODE_1944_length_3799_cov_9.077027_2_plen_32_part_00
MLEQVSACIYLFIFLNDGMNYMKLSLVNNNV